MDIVLFAALILKITDFMRLVANFGTHKSAVVTQAVAWVVGVGAVWVGGEADVTAGLVLPGTGAALGSLDGGSVVLVGLLAASLASVLVDAKQAFDATDSAAKPELIGPRPEC